MNDLTFTTITLNPAIDKTILTTNKLKIGDVHKSTSTWDNPGGKGINVAKALRLFNKNVQVTGLLGQEKSELFTELFVNNNIDDNFLKIPKTNRINIMLTDGLGNEIKVNEQGWHDIPYNIEDLITKLCQTIPQNSIVAICGSLPPALPVETLTALVTELHNKGCTVALDSSKRALQAGCDGRPSIIKPNLEEISDLVGFPPIKQHEIIEVLNKLTTKHDIVIFTTGENKAYFATKDKIYCATPPTIIHKDSTSAGDNLFGVFLANYFPGKIITKEVIALSIAAGSAAVECPSSTTPKLERIIELSKLVKIEEIS